MSSGQHRASLVARQQTFREFALHYTRRHFRSRTTITTSSMQSTSVSTRRAGLNGSAVTPPFGRHEGVTDKVCCDVYDKHRRYSGDAGKWITGVRYSLLKGSLARRPVSRIRAAE